MFNKKDFSMVLKRINDTYDSMTDFAKKASFDRTYISKYINMKLDNPPTPKILAKISNASNGVVNYEDLMKICGYINENDFDTYLLSMLGLSIEDMQQFDNAINSLNMNDDEKKILYSTMSKFRDNFYHKKNDNSFSLKDELNKYNPVSQKKLISAFELYQIFLEKIIDFSETMVEPQKTKEAKMVLTPVYGKISAGLPNWAEECLEGYLPIDPNLMGIINPEECFFLRVDGESMNKVIRNGAYALIRKQDIVENGEIAAVLVNGFDATLKKFSKQGNLVILEPMSEDSSFTTQVYNKDTQIKILGKYIGKFEMN